MVIEGSLRWDNYNERTRDVQRMHRYTWNGSLWRHERKSSQTSARGGTPARVEIDVYASLLEEHPHPYTYPWVGFSQEFQETNIYLWTSLETSWFDKMQLKLLCSLSALIKCNLSVKARLCCLRSHFLFINTQHHHSQTYIVMTSGVYDKLLSCNRQL